MKNVDKYKYIEEKLKDGYTIQGFRSGGGLRVLCMSKKDTEKEFYGESCDLINALRVLDDDVKAGGRKYKNVYGKIEPHYLTGSYGSDSDILDLHVCSGRKFDVKFETNLFFVDCSTEEDLKTPKSILERVYKKHETVFWKVPKEHSLSEYIFKSSPYGPLGDGSIACSTSFIPVISGKEKNEKMITVPRIGFGDTLEKALKSAERMVKYENPQIWYEIPAAYAEMKEAIYELHNN